MWVRIIFPTRILVLATSVVQLQSFQFQHAWIVEYADMCLRFRLHTVILQLTSVTVTATSMFGPGEESDPITIGTVHYTGNTELYLIGYA